MSPARRSFFHRRWPLLAGLGIVLFLISLGLTGDPLYGAFVRWRYAQWEKGILRDADGVRTGCRSFTEGTGSPALLMIHGFGDCPLVFRPLAERLADRGYEIRAMRLPGFAEPMERYHQADLDAWTAAVESELSALRTSHAEVWLVGHSTGAAIAIHQQLDGPTRANGLILLAPLIQVADHRSPVLPARTWFEMLRDHLRMTPYIENPFPKDLRDPAAGVNLPEDRFVPLSIYTSLFALIDRIRHRAAEIDAPVLMALSPHDEVIDSAAAAEYFEDLSCVRKRKVQFTESGHMMMIDYDRDRVADAVDGFIRPERHPQEPSSPAGFATARTSLPPNEG